MGKVRIGINGFGRIGRLATRFLLESDVVEIIHINELYTDAEGIAYLLEFDSVHGKYENHTISSEKDCIIVDSKKITTSSYELPGQVPWDEMDVDMVLACDGVFKTTEKLQGFFDRKVKRVLVSAPVKGELNVVMGCNDELMTPDHKIITAASCTTNCIAPVIKALDQAFGIEKGCINTIHNITLTQPLLDCPMTKKKDLRRFRSGATNISLTSSGSSDAIQMIYPHLQGKLTAIATRVPVANASVTDLTFVMKDNVTVEQINETLQKAADDKIMGFETRPLVSTDYINDERSSIVDSASTRVIDGNMVKVMAWYDNEYGYSKRMADIAEKMASYF